MFASKVAKPQTTNSITTNKLVFQRSTLAAPLIADSAAESARMLQETIGSQVPLGYRDFSAIPTFPLDRASRPQALGPTSLPGPEQPTQPVQALRSPNALPSAAPGLSGSGWSLPDALRSDFERRFSHDFSGVRVHTDVQADASARAFNARAFTTGHDIAFRRGEYDPHSTAGRRLLAHELTHVVQQRAGVRFAKRVSQPGDAAELEADRAAAAVMAGGQAGPIRAEASAVARQPPGPGKDYIDIEVDPDSPPGQINFHLTGPTFNPKWVDKALTAAGYTIWLNGFMLFLAGMGPNDPGIIVPESDVDFLTQQAEPINHYIYNSRSEARDAVTKAPKRPGGLLPFAYYWGAGGLVIVPTIICQGSAPRTTATMWDARKSYAEYVQRALADLAIGMVVGKVLSGAYGWARAGGGGGGPTAPPGRLTNPAGEGPMKPPATEPATKAPPVTAPTSEPATKAPAAKTPAPEPAGTAPSGDVPQSGPDLFKRTAQAPGGQAEKSKFFEHHSEGLRQRTGWAANRTGDATDGSIVYHGEAQSKALVITRDGRVFTGTWGQHVKLQVGPSGPQLVCDWSLPGWKQW